MATSVTRAKEIIQEEGISELCREASTFCLRQYFNVRNGDEYNTNGVDIFKESWDNLIILDACRYDFFRRFNDIAGTLETRVSRGSMTREFIRGNFSNRTLHDTVYLSSNPWYGRLYDDINSELHHYSLCERDAFDGIATRPSTVTEAAREYDSEYPNKRLIVHYFQPHGPYFTEDGEERYRFPAENKRECSPAQFKDAYATNLKLALSETERLLESLRGKTVVTADHGELLGERLPPLPVQQYQHPPGVYVDGLVKVPWLEIDGGERKTVLEERNPNRWTDSDDAPTQVEDQLDALGYK